MLKPASVLIQKIYYKLIYDSITTKRSAILLRSPFSEFLFSRNNGAVLLFLVREGERSVKGEEILNDSMVYLKIINFRLSLLTKQQEKKEYKN